MPAYSTTGAEIQCVKNVETLANVNIKFSNGWKFNKQYPWKFVVKEANNNIVVNNFVIQPKKNEIFFELNIKSTKLGQAEIILKGSFSVCSDSRCIVFRNEEIGIIINTSKRPVVAAFELKDLKGKRVRLKDLRSKVVVVSFWATWCVPCKAELKVLSKLYKKYKAKGLEVLAISTDGPETLSEVRTFPRRYRWTMPVLVDVEGVAIAALNPRGTCPYTVFIDREGRRAFAHEGFAAGDAASFEQHITELLAENHPDVLTNKTKR